MESMQLQYDFLLNMLEFYTGEHQYEIIKFLYLQYYFVLSMLEFHTEEPQYEINHLQYDFVLNMLQFHTGKPQYEINVSSVWFRAEFAGIPYWEASVRNQCIFTMISY